jgi:ferredoxin
VRLCGSGSRRRGCPADRLGGEEIADPSIWLAVREQTLPFSIREGPLWRISLPAAAPALNLPGSEMTEWGGALRWLRTDLPGGNPAPAGLAWAATPRCSGGTTAGRRVPAAAAAMLALHQRVKLALDPHGHLQSRPHVRRALMQTNLADFIRDTPGKEAEAILRSCVHCGFCNATCPTYQLLGDELDGPRGRIYLMKQMLEGRPVSATRLHLDRCLTCRNCETTCPSGVQYGRLIDIGRRWWIELSPRPASQNVCCAQDCAKVLQSPVFGVDAEAGPCVRACCPSLREHLPGNSPTFIQPNGGSSDAKGEPPAPHAAAGRLRTAGLAPETNAAAARVLDRLGIRLVAAPNAGCCGAIDQHLAPGSGEAAMRRNIDAWWPASSKPGRAAASKPSS